MTSNVRRGTQRVPRDRDSATRSVPTPTTGAADHAPPRLRVLTGLHRPASPGVVNPGPGGGPMPHDVLVNRLEGWSAADLDALAVRLARPAAGVLFGVVVHDGTGAIVAATPAAEDILGLTFDQMIGRTSMDPRWATVDEKMGRVDGREHPSMRARASRQPVRDAVLGVHRPTADGAGNHVWLSVTAVPTDLVPGGPQFVLTVFSVMTGPRATELRLMESEARFRFMADNSSDMVAWQRFDTTFLWVSPMSSALLGRTPEQLVGTRSIDLAHPDDVPKVRAVLSAIAAGTVHNVVVRRMRHADGHYVWVETVSRIAEGEVATAAELQTSSRCVDDRIAAQQAQAEAETSRDRAMGLFRTAMEHAAIGMAICRLDGRITEVNGALCRLLGRGGAELKQAAFVDFAHPDDRPAAIEERSVLLSGRTVPPDTERRYLRSDGVVVWVQASSVLLPAEDGEPRLVLTQMQDVTARRDALEQLTRLAVTDSLTGLCNRAVLVDRLARSLDDARRGRGNVGVVFVDLDGFKGVNDAFGHEIGDRLLQQVAARLCAAVRAGDTVARLGGDEFVLLCERVEDLPQVRSVAGRVSAALGECFVIGEHRLQISASIGVALGDGSSGEILGRADAAMYRAKRRGRGLVAEHRGTVAVGAVGESDCG